MEALAYNLQRTIPAVRGLFSTPSPLLSKGQYGNINPFALRSGSRLPLRCRLTHR
jgi:hypothetical protein